MQELQLHSLPKGLYCFIVLLYNKVSRHREPPEVGLGEKLLGEVCIGGWSWVCQPYIESATTLPDKSA